jgi:hypothetical protein
MERARYPAIIILLVIVLLGLTSPLAAASQPGDRLTVAGMVNFQIAKYQK